MKVFIVGNIDYRHVILSKRITDSGFISNQLKNFKFSDFDDFIKGAEKIYVVIINNLQDKIELQNNLGLSISYVAELQDILNILTISSDSINGVVYLSDLAIYGEPYYTPYDEAHSIDSGNNLSVAYNFCENLVNNFYLKLRIPTIILRCPDTIGTAYNISPLDKPGLVSSSNFFYFLLDKFIKHEDPFIIKAYDNHLINNTYIHVSDLANAVNRCVEVMEIDGTFGIMNLGSEMNTDYKEMISLFESIFGYNISISDIGKSFAPNYGMSCYEKAMQILSPWVPKWTMEETIKFAKKSMSEMIC